MTTLVAVLWAILCGVKQFICGSFSLIGATVRWLKANGTPYVKALWLVVKGIGWLCVRCTFILWMYAAAVVGESAAAKQWFLAHESRVLIGAMVSTIILIRAFAWFIRFLDGSGITQAPEAKPVNTQRIGW